MFTLAMIITVQNGPVNIACSLIVLLQSYYCLNLPWHCILNISFSSDTHLHSHIIIITTFIKCSCFRKCPSRLLFNKEKFYEVLFKTWVLNIWHFGPLFGTLYTASPPSTTDEFLGRPASFVMRMCSRPAHFWDIQKVKIGKLVDFLNPNL